MELLIGIALGTIISASFLVGLGWYISRDGYETTVTENPQKNQLH